MVLKIPKWEKESAPTLVDLSLLILLTVTSNSTWGSSSVFWWGSVFLFAGCFFLTQKIKFEFHPAFFVWYGIFFAYCALSCFWSYSVSRVPQILKAMIVQFILLLLIQIYLSSKKKIKRFLLLLAGSAVINSVYLLTTTSLVSIGVSESYTSRLGDNEGWNSNAVGLLTSISAVFLIYLFTQERKKIKKLFLLAGIVFLSIVTLMTGSRKALFILLFCASVFWFLSSKKGTKIRTLILIALFVLLFLYLALRVSFFYDIIGWRIEGLLAQITGVGKTDISTDLRESYIKAAWSVFLKNPAVGVGVDNFRFYNTSLTGHTAYAHNNYLEVLADFGILGFLLYYAGYVFLLWSLIRRCVKKKRKEDFLFLAVLLGILLGEWGLVDYFSFRELAIFACTFSWLALDEKAEKTTTISEGDL